MLKAARAVSGVVGGRVPPVTLFSCLWGDVDLEFMAGRQGEDDPGAVIYFYPGDGLHAEVDGELAKGFQEHYFELVGQLRFNLIGVSAQEPDHQVRHLTTNCVEHIVVADPQLCLALKLGLPTYVGNDGIKRYPRLALVVEQGRVTKVFRPVCAPGETAARVVAWLRDPHDESFVRW